MRDIAVALIVFASLPVILWRPYIGVLMWTWIGFMNPHRLTWNFAYDMPFALMVALATLIGLLMSQEPKKIPWTREVKVLVIFVLWMLLTTFFALYPAAAWPHLEKVAKIQLMIIVTLMLMQSKERLNLLVWVMTLSLAFYGVKGGIFTITNGGVFHVRGPPGSFIGGDNEMGLALIMTIPLLRYMQMTAKSMWARYALAIAMVLSAIAAIGSQSRGAMLGIVAMGTFLWLKGRNKVLTGLLGLIAIVAVLMIMPQQWFDRMSTITNYEQDGSAMGRINAWQMAFNMAKDKPLGGGFDSFQPMTFYLYAPDPENVHDSHSIYFEILGEHGFIGLGLFLMLGLMTWRTASWVIRHARDDPQKRWAADLVTMVQVSLVGYASAGAFLGLAYFDFYYTLVAVIVLCKVIISREPTLQEASKTSAASSGLALPSVKTQSASQPLRISHGTTGIERRT